MSPDDSVSLEELRERAIEISELFEEPGHDVSSHNVARSRGLVFSRRLARALCRETPSRLVLQSHSTRTLKWLRHSKGIRYFALEQLAHDVIGWCGNTNCQEKKVSGTDFEIGS
jgi:hypothetical protein